MSKLFKEWWDSLKPSQRFVDDKTVITAHNAFVAGVKIERERCAQICEELFRKDLWIYERENSAAQQCAEEIREGSYP